MMRFKKNGFLVLLSVIVLLQLSQLCPAQDIYVLSTNGPHYDKNAELIPFEQAEAVARMIDNCFRGNVPKENLIFYGDPEKWPPIQGAGNQHSVGISKKELLDAIKTCPAGNNDTIVVYLTAHGGGGGPENQHHMLLMADGHNDLMKRASIVEKVRAKGVRLSVVITNSCAKSVMGPPRFAEGVVTEISPLFDELFIKARGLVDLNSASRGEYAFLGIFTPVLIEYLDSNKRARNLWPTVVTNLQANLNTRYKEEQSRADPQDPRNKQFINQKRQTIWVVTRPLPGKQQ